MSLSRFLHTAPSPFLPQILIHMPSSRCARDRGAVLTLGSVRLPPSWAFPESWRSRALCPKDSEVEMPPRSFLRCAWEEAACRNQTRRRAEARVTEQAAGPDGMDEVSSCNPEKNKQTAKATQPEPQGSEHQCRPLPNVSAVVPPPSPPGHGWLSSGSEHLSLSSSSLAGPQLHPGPGAGPQLI